MLNRQVKEELQRAATRFRDFGVVDMAVVPDRLKLQPNEQDVLEKLCVFHLALARNMEHTSRTTSELMNLSLGIANIMYFHHGDMRDLRLQRDGLPHAQQVMDIASKLNAQVADGMKGHLKMATGVMHKRPNVTVLEKNKTIEQIQEAAEAATYGTRKTSEIAFYFDNCAKGGAVFAPEEKREVPDDVTVDGHIRNMFRDIAGKWGSVVSIHADMMRLILARAAYVQTNLVPVAPETADNWQVDIAANQRFLFTVSTQLDVLDEMEQRGYRCAGMPAPSVG